MLAPWPMQDLPVAVDADFEEGHPAEAGSDCDAEEHGSFTGPEREDVPPAAAAETGAPAADKQALKCACCGEPAKDRWIGCACGALHPTWSASRSTTLEVGVSHTPPPLLGSSCHDQRYPVLSCCPRC